MRRTTNWLLLVMLLSLGSAVLSQSGIPEIEAFQTIHMVSASNGWALGYTEGEFMIDAYYVLHTEDGAITWEDRTPGGALPPTGLGTAEPALFVLDDTHVWIALIEQDSPNFTIWRTSDGEIWSSSVVETFGVNTSLILSFADSAHGWLLARDCCYAGNEGARLYATADGGGTWALINQDAFLEYSQSTAPRTLSSGYHTGMGFADAQVGWMTESSILGWGGITRTTDSGLTWNYLQVSTPEGVVITEYETPMCGFEQPQVFSDTAMSVLADCAREDANAWYLMTTADGGLTWLASLLPVEFLWRTTQLIMATPERGWVRGLTPENHAVFTVYETLDGGKTWEQVAAQPDQTGWAFSDDGVVIPLYGR